MGAPAAQTSRIFEFRIAGMALHRILKLLDLLHRRLRESALMAPGQRHNLPSKQTMRSLSFTASAYFIAPGICAASPPRGQDESRSLDRLDDGRNCEGLAGARDAQERLVGEPIQQTARLAMATTAGQ